MPPYGERKDSKTEREPEKLFQQFQIGKWGKKKKKKKTEPNGGEIHAVRSSVLGWTFFSRSSNFSHDAIKSRSNEYSPNKPTAQSSSSSFHMSTHHQSTSPPPNKNKTIGTSTFQFTPVFIYSRGSCGWNATTPLLFFFTSKKKKRPKLFTFQFVIDVYTHTRPSTQLLIRRKKVVGGKVYYSKT